MRWNSQSDPLIVLSNMHGIDVELSLMFERKVRRKKKKKKTFNYIVGLVFSSGQYFCT